MEWIFEAQNWVSEVIAWYTWWQEKTANYDQVSTGKTDHREAVKVVYDPDSISYAQLVELFWTQIDPSDDGGQFADRGYQYTTCIYYGDEDEKNIACESKKSLEESGKFQYIATAIEPRSDFYRAEKYHQDYYKKSPFRYGLYKRWSGREAFIEENWRDKIQELSWEKLEDILTPLQYEVTQNGGTERAFDNEYWDNREDGIYVDIIDGTPLFSSLDKYDSWSGWPSFTKPIDREQIIEEDDNTHGMSRVEVRSNQSDSHLWHVFTDGPEQQWWFRYCINSAALRFIPYELLEQKGYGEYKKLFE